MLLREFDPDEFYCENEKRKIKPKKPKLIKEAEGRKLSARKKQREKEVILKNTVDITETLS